MPFAVRRHRTRIVKGLIVHDDRRISWREADRVAKRRLDRRKNYCVIRRQVCSIVRYRQSCSGCSIGMEDRGGGCRECGYQGVVRCEVWMPDDGSEPR